MTDSKNNKIEGKTDENGKVFIYDMGCGAFEILLGEGSDKFAPTEKIKNNPVIQSSPEKAVLAGEYFALYVEMSKLNLVVYDPHSQLAAGMGIMHSIPPQYKPAYERFCVLVRKIRREDPAFRKEIGRIHNSISAEVATLARKIDSAVLLMGEIILGCIPVVGPAIDAICIAEWCYDTYQKPALLDDPMHQMDGVFCAIGVIPGLGDAMKIRGRAITDAMRKVKTGSPEKIQEAIKLIRGLSNGNIVKWIAKMRSEIRIYADEAKVILTKMKVALQKVIDESSLGNNWIITLMKDTFHKMVEYLGKLFDLVDATVTLIDSELVAFIPKIMTQAVGSARAKGTCSASGLEIEKGASGDYRTEEESNEDIKRTNDTGLTNSAVGIAAAMAAVGFGRVRGGRHATAASGTHKAPSNQTHAQTSSQHSKPDTAKPATPSAHTEPAPARNKVSEPAAQHSTESQGDKAQTSKTQKPQEGQKNRQDSGAQDIKAGSKTSKQSADPADKNRASQQDSEIPGHSDKAESNGDPVNMATGAVVEQRTDLQLSGLLPVSLVRCYRSTGERHPGLLGTLWRSNWDISLELDGGLATLIDGEFNRAVFVLPGEGEVNRAPSNPEWRLTREQGQLIVRHVGGLRYRFAHALGMQLCLTGD
ncbi:MAG: DUF6531 domain-containing protein [Symbiopectobacterium sp.]|uniref:DUF6531 domain-containing protein n=1 Tax=Symbiopectobacterium sp. TaxID=2952789 RepID=UPI0039ECCC34